MPATLPSATEQEAGLLTVEQIFGAELYKAATFGPARWRKDETGYTLLVAAATDPERKELIQYDAAAGTAQPLLTLAQLPQDDSGQPLKIEDYHWSDDQQQLLIFTNGQRVWRHNTRGDYWVWHIGQNRWHKLGGDKPASRLMFAKFAPDGHAAAYVYENNLYVERLDDGHIIQLTHDGTPTLINGTSDWVYEEEFGLRDGFHWSPDSQQIAYWQFDASHVGTFHLINNTDSLYPQLTPIPYPKVGTANSACRVGVIAATGGATTWFDVPGDPQQHYLPKMAWVGQTRQVLIQQLNRHQSWNHLWLGNSQDGSVQTVFVEEDPAYVNVFEVKWLRDGQEFLWLSDRDGWRHLYRMGLAGQEPCLLTPGDYDVISLAGVAEQAGWVYFIASPENPTQRYLYRVGLDGQGQAERLSPLTQPGTHTYQLSEQGKWAFHSYATFDTPPVITLIRLPEHEPVRVLEANAGLVEKVNAIQRQPTEFFRVNIGEGVELDGWCIKPPDFDATRRYPVLFHVYGEPGSQTVTDQWPGNNGLWHWYLAQQGFVVMSVDNRGTPAPRGRGWRKTMYRQIGIVNPVDQAAAAHAIFASRPYLDPERVGMWGWSGGATTTLHCLFKYPNLYKTGVAVAAISDQRFYDTVYQERYMDLPDDNPDGFRDGSPINFVHQLEGNLLLIHGTGDDNVHYQSFEVLVNALIKQNKYFEMMTYPNRTHAIKEGDNTLRHLYETMTRYLRDHL